MTEEEKDKELEDLFRHKLEESEVSPGSDLTRHFMRRLNRKEFMRFTPSRLNIFYLGAAVAAAATMSGLLIFAPASEKPMRAVQKVQTPQVELAKPAITVQENIKEEDKKEQEVSVPSRDEIKETPEASGKVTAQPVRKKEEISSVKGMADKVRVVKEEDIKDISLSGTETPRAAFEASSTSGCVPLHVTFHNLSSGASKIEWSFGDGGFSSEDEVDYIYDLPGTYNVILTASNDAGRKAVIATTVEVWSRPKASFEMPETDLTIVDDHVTFTNLSSGATRYQWHFGDGNTSESFEPTHKYEKYGKYDVVLIAISENGCTDTVSIADAFTDSGLYLRFPNAFTPDEGGPSGGYYSQRSDLNNQVFHPVSSGVVNYDLKIFSKQGLLVFETDDLQKGWDGYYKGRLCSPGVYIWKVRGTYRNGSQIVLSGDVTLLNY